MNYLLILSLIIILFFIVENLNKKEYFRYCSNCNKLSERSCYNCQNCGWCINNNLNGICKQGDNKGPYFSDNCKEWYYSGNKIYPDYLSWKNPKIPWFEINKKNPYFYFYKPTNRRYYPKRYYKRRGYYPRLFF